MHHSRSDSRSDSRYCHRRGDGNDTLIGIEGVTGSKFNDTLRGHAYLDSILCGGAGNDTLIGDTGRDLLKGGAGDDRLIGGEGYDSADYFDAISGVIVNLKTGTATGGAGNDTLSGIVSVIGSNFNDTLIGGIGGGNFYGGKGNDSLIGTDYFPNRLNGGDGNDSLIGGIIDDDLNGGLGADVLNGGEGSDTADYSDAISAVTVNLNTGTATGGAGNDILKGIERVLGSQFNDILIGSDTLSGNDTFVDDENYVRLYGDLGNDVLVGGSDSFNQLDGGSGDDILKGGNKDDGLTGGLGDDVLTGGKGNDYLYGSSGDDFLTGGEGSDSASFFVKVTVNLATGTATGEGNDTLKEIENVSGSNANDTLIGDANANILNGSNGDDWLTGGQGDDTLIGGEGIDWASYSDATSSVTVNLVTDPFAGTTTGGAGNDTLRYIENVQGSKFNDKLNGNDLDNSLDGSAGNDTLNGQQGKDTLTGGDGKDIFKFTVNGPADKITDFNVPNDTIQLENGVFKALTTTGVLAVNQFKVGSKAADANDFVIYNKATGVLLYDADGNGANAAAVQVAILSAGLNMTNADFVVI